jgi:hypothetical protein
LDRDASQSPGGRLTELICRALLDGDLCVRLFADPAATAEAFGLTPDEVQALRRLDRRKFELRSAQLRSA